MTRCVCGRDGKSDQPKRHVFDIETPNPELVPDARGQLDTSAAPAFIVKYRRVPAAFKPLNGQEREVARQQFARATSMVTITPGRDWVIGPEDRLVRRGGTKAGKPLNIGYVRDPEVAGGDVEILCAEVA